MSGKGDENVLLPDGTHGIFLLVYTGRQNNRNTYNRCGNIPICLLCVF